MRIVDSHTHAFPDAIARRAMETLTAGAPDYPPHHDGSLTGLLASMDRAGITAAVIANIATKPSQERPILDWSKQIASDRIIPFISLHPDGQDHDALLDEAVQAGIRGVKFHCLYQGFVVDEPRTWPMYERIAERDLIILFHAGRDLCWLDSDDAAPSRLLRIHRRLPHLRMIAAHFGGWRMWEEVAETLAGEDVFIETSFTLGDVDDRLWDRIWSRHSEDRLLFGTDSPWADQSEALRLLRERLGEGETLQRVISRNALRLLGFEQA